MNKENSSCIKKILDRRWSRRSFSDSPIPKSDLVEIFESGKKVASSYNEQPWRFIIASKKDNHYNKLLSCLVDFNQQWGKTAPVIGVAFGKKHFTQKDKVNQHRFHDVGAFLAVASLRAVELGYQIHEMAGFSEKLINENFDVPDEFEPITMFVLGSPGDIEQLPEDLQKEEMAQSSRKNVSDFVFHEKWEESYL